MGAGAAATAGSLSTTDNTLLQRRAWVAEAREGGGARWLHGAEAGYGGTGTGRPKKALDFCREALRG